MNGEQPADEQPARPEPTPPPASFLAMAEAATTNAERAISNGDLESAGMWRTVARYLTEGARAAASVPPEVQTVTAAALALVAGASESGVRRARRVSTGGGNAYIPYDAILPLIDALDLAFPGIIERYTGKRLTA